MHTIMNKPQEAYIKIAGILWLWSLGVEDYWQTELGRNDTRRNSLISDTSSGDGPSWLPLVVPQGYPLVDLWLELTFALINLWPRLTFDRCYIVSDSFRTHYVSAVNLVETSKKIIIWVPYHHS